MRNNLLKLIVLALAGSPAFLFAAPPTDKPGYTDTPMLPSGKWHVHDPNRPVPPVVTPGKSFSDGAPPPSDAIVLFDGHDLSNWKSVKDGGEAKWLIHHQTNSTCCPVNDSPAVRGPQPFWKGPAIAQPCCTACTSCGAGVDYMQVVPKSGDIETKQTFGDFQLHVEWAEPTPPVGTSQERGNSGVFLQGLYEIQVLDSYNNPTYPDGQCGGIYGQTPPLANACRPPGQWQTYDIIFRGPHFGPDHEVLKPATVTVIQNGVLLHQDQAILGPTGHKILAHYAKDTPDRGPIRLQDHHNPVRFRNIWIREIGEEEKP